MRCSYGMLILLMGVLSLGAGGVSTDRLTEQKKSVSNPATTIGETKTATEKLGGQANGETTSLAKNRNCEQTVGEQEKRTEPIIALLCVTTKAGVVAWGGIPAQVRVCGGSPQKQLEHHFKLMKP